MAGTEGSHFMRTLPKESRCSASNRYGWAVKGGTLGGLRLCATATAECGWRGGERFGGGELERRGHHWSLRASM